MNMEGLYLSIQFSDPIVTSNYYAIQKIDIHNRTHKIYLKEFDIEIGLRIIEINYAVVKKSFGKKSSHRKKVPVLVNFHTDISSAAFDLLLILVTPSRGQRFLFEALFLRVAHA